MSIKYGSIPRESSLPVQQLVALVAASVYSHGDITVEDAVTVATKIIKAAENVNKK